MTRQKELLRFRKRRQRACHVDDRVGVDKVVLYLLVETVKVAETRRVHNSYFLQQLSVVTYVDIFKSFGESPHKLFQLFPHKIVGSKAYPLTVFQYSFRLGGLAVAYGIYCKGLGGSVYRSNGFAQYRVDYCTLAALEIPQNHKGERLCAAFCNGSVPVAEMLGKLVAENRTQRLVAQQSFKLILYSLDVRLSGSVSRSGLNGLNVYCFGNFGHITYPPLQRRGLSRTLFQEPACLLCVYPLC